MTIEEIRELIKLVTETGVAELEVQRGENRVRIVRAPGGGIQHVVVPAVTVRLRLLPSHAPPPSPRPRRPRPHRNDPTLVAVKSPIVGTFYEAPSPGRRLLSSRSATPFRWARCFASSSP